MSVAMTIDSVRAREKTVTRRRVDTWRTLRVGDRLMLIEKGQGLPKGSKQVTIAYVVVVDVRVESLGSIHAEIDGTKAEGLGHLTCSEFVAFWARGHGYRAHQHPADIDCRRIEWRYLAVPADG